MKDGEHHHDRSDPEGKHNHRKLAGIILIVVVFALVAYDVAQTALDTANINNVFELVVNNTDLYPTQRTNHTVYWANESPIAVYILFHAIDVATPQHFDSNFTINGSVVLDKDFNSAAGSGAHEHWSFYTIVPKGANYSVTNSTNVYQIEWREYPILSGKNGTLSLNQTFITNGSSFNSTYDNTTKIFNFYNSTQAFPNTSITALQNNDTNTAYTNIRNTFVLNQTINGIEINKTGAKSRVFFDQLQGLNISLWGENMYFTNNFFLDDTNIPGWMIAQDSRPEQDSIFMYHATPGANPRPAVAVYTFGNKTLSTVTNLSLNPTIKPSCITMYSPDGTAYRFTIANGGTTNVAAGTCG